MSSSSRSRFPWFNEYLTTKAAEPQPQREQVANITGCLLMVLGLPAAGVLLGTATGNWLVGLGTALVGLPTLGGLWYWMHKKAAMPRSEEEKRAREFREVLGAFIQLRQQKKLNKWVDPAALQLLEAGAYHWRRVHDSLNGPFWSSNDLPSHYQTIRQQALSTANQGMAEMLAMGQSCIGKPDRDKKKDVENALSSLFELEIADALGGLRDISRSDWRDYSFHSEAGRAIFEPCRQIAERLKSLADEIEAVKADAVIQKVNATQDKPASTDAIDLILDELRAVKRAESELDGEERLHH